MGEGATTKLGGLVLGTTVEIVGDAHIEVAVTPTVGVMVAGAVAGGRIAGSLGTIGESGNREGNDCIGASGRALLPVIAPTILTTRRSAEAAPGGITLCARRPHSAAATTIRLFVTITTRPSPHSSSTGRRATSRRATSYVGDTSGNGVAITATPPLVLARLSVPL